MTQIIQNIRLKTGAIIMALGLLSPLLITFVIASDWPTSMKTVISGLLAFGIPELFMLLGIVVMGKPGYNLIREKVSRCFKRYSPPDRVSRKRYYLGLVLFSIPLINVSSCPTVEEASTFPSEVFQDMKRLKPEDMVPAFASSPSDKITKLL